MGRRPASRCCVMSLMFRRWSDNDLLPYSTNNQYHRHSLKLIACRFLEDRQPGRDRYNGGLLSDNPKVSQAGSEFSGSSPCRRGVCSGVGQAAYR